jgi:hypothetical protein
MADTIDALRKNFILKANPPQVISGRACLVKQVRQFASSQPETNVIKRFCLYYTNFCSKLECLSLASSTSLVKNSS